MTAMDQCFFVLETFCITNYMSDHFRVGKEVVLLRRRTLCTKEWRTSFRQTQDTDLAWVSRTSLSSHEVKERGRGGVEWTPEI